MKILPEFTVQQRLSGLPRRLVVKNPPAGDRIQSLGREDPLEKEMATHSRILAWRIPRTEEPGGLQCRSAAAESLPSCPTLCDPVDGSHQAPRPRDSPGKSTGAGCHCLLQCMKVRSESEVAQSCPTLSDPRDGTPPGKSTGAGCLAFSGASGHRVPEGSRTS